MTKTGVSVFRSETLETSGRRICKRTSFEFEANLAKWNPIPPVIRIRMCVCVCVCVSSSGIFGQTEGGHRITRDRNENIVPPSYISFVPWMRDTFVISLYIHDRVEARVSYSRIGNPVETNSGKSSLGSGRLVPLPLPRNSFCELFDTGTLFKNVRGISEARHFSGNYLLGRIEGEHFYHPSLSPIETELSPLVQDHPFFFRPLIRVSLECIFIVRSPSIFARMILNVRSIFN